MILSLGRGQTPLRIETSLKENFNIRKVVLVWKKTHYDLHVSIKSETVNNYGKSA